MNLEGLVFFEIKHKEQLWTSLEFRRPDPMPDSLSLLHTFDLLRGAHQMAPMELRYGLIGKDPLQRHHTKGQIFFQERYFHVQRQQHDRLVIRYESPILSITVAAFHAPHNGHTLEVRTAWWQEVNEQLKSDAGKTELILLMDANARLGTWTDGAIGDNSDDLEDANGEMLRGLCQNLCVFPPATWKHLHFGDNFTWQHPTGRSRARLDYVLIPSTWWHADVKSWTDPIFHSGHSLPDHTAVFLEVSWTSSTTNAVKRKIPFDNREIAKPENAHIIAAIMADLPHYPWELDASEHALFLTKEIHKRLSEAFPSKRKKNQPIFVNKHTQGLYDRLTQQKRHLRTLVKEEKLYILRFLFNVWRERQMMTSPDDLWSFNFAKKRLQIERDTIWLALQLKTKLKQDRQNYVQEIANQAKNMNVSDLYKSLRPILPKSKSPGCCRPLQRVKKLDGTYSSSREEFDARWIQHFSSMEAGEVMTPEAFIQNHLDKNCDRAMPAKWEADNLPQLSWIERAVQQLRRNKTPGPDALVNEVWKASPSHTALTLLPLLWKYSLRLTEPVTAKGGQIIPVYKHKGATDECGNHRGIMLMNSMGKLMRAAHRPLLAAPWFRNSSEMQLGGKPLFPVLFGAQAIRCCIGSCKSKGQPIAILFADVESAYYQALRQLAAGGLHRDEDVAALVKAFNLEPSTMHEIYDALHGIWIGMFGWQCTPISTIARISVLYMDIRHR